MTDTITRSQLATLLEQEAHNALAERIRAGSEPAEVLGDGNGGLRKALRRSRYHDAISRNAKQTFADIVSGRVTVTV
jgi:hypothetical protein